MTDNEPMQISDPPSVIEPASASNPSTINESMDTRKPIGKNESP